MMTTAYSSVILNGCTTGFLHKRDLVKNKVVCIMVSSSENSATNSWNQNLQSGNLSNNNKYNGNVVRPVLALDSRRIHGWMEAYADCISNKMTSEQCTLYRLHEDDLVSLMMECEERKYEPYTSTCFIVTRPKLREIFAANFRDRIVQHWICLRIEPLLETRFKAQEDVSWNCRKGKGTQRAVHALRNDILQVSDNYHRDAWVGRFDIRSFFMSIDIEVLERLTIAFVRKYYKADDLELLVYLLQVTIRHRPQDDCYKRGDVNLWEKLPPHKSLFNASRCRGMPIGNITSQLLANFYMSFLDGYMMTLCKDMGAKYERFVDDFAVVCRKKEEVLLLRDKAEKFLKDNLHLTLHRDKVYIQHATKGVYFVGGVIKMHRLYLANRTTGGMVNMLRELQGYIAQIKNYALADAYVLEHYESSINSYMGFTIDKNAYALKRRVIKQECPMFFKYFYVKGRFLAVRLIKRYRVKQQLKLREIYE